MEKQPFYYVYILQSVGESVHFYSGFTEDIRLRLKAHNQGCDPHTAKFRPWRIKTCMAFTNRDRALAFERYLKTSSGRAFAKKRL
jgi:putative endonuclease